MRDITGINFGKLVALKFDGIRKRAVYWLCQCECGNTKSVAKSNLIQNRVTHCGCSRKQNASKHPFNLTGMRFGKLVALKFDRREDLINYWLWQCDCGNQKVIARGSVLSNGTQSCGCLRGFKKKIDA